MTETGTVTASDSRELAREERRERARAMRAIIAKYPNSKRARLVSPLMLDQDIFEDRIKECGGDDEFLFFFTAQVMEGVTPRGFCEHYGIPVGLLGAWILEEPERLARYEQALKWVADDMVSSTVAIADDGENDTYVDENGNRKVDTDVIARSKLRVDTRLKVAGVLDRKRFGTEKAAGSAPLTLVFDAGLVGAASELLGRIRGREIDVTPEAG